jgi:hypothetical protein
MTRFCLRVRAGLETTPYAGLPLARVNDDLSATLLRSCRDQVAPSSRE